LEKWDLSSLSIKPPILDMEWQIGEQDKDAAWDLYVELVTRGVIQRPEPGVGDEAAAMKGIYDLFPLTRSTIKRYGRDGINFTRIAVVMLNQKVRPFTDRWHRRVLAGALNDANRGEFREELAGLQTDLRNYTRLLGDLAEVEDLTDLESV
jgi:hypothetical protein